MMGAGSIDSSMKYHMMNAKAHGVTKKEIAAIITHAAFYVGWPKGWAMFLLIFVFMFTGCGTSSAAHLTQQTTAVSVETEKSNGSVQPEPQSSSAETQTLETLEQAEKDTAKIIRFTIGNNVIHAELAENPAAAELAELLQSGPITMSASNYGGFEKICSLGSRLTTNDVQTTAQVGDIMLYQGSNIVIFYGSNSWAYTRLAKVVDEDIPVLNDVLNGSETEVILELESTSTESRTLVVNFSCTGNTKPIAQMAAALLNADFYEIVPEIPYTAEDLHYQDHNCRANKEQNDDSARPAIAGEKLDISGYDTILISFPIWWGREPRIIDTFMESYDFSDKTLAAFCTSGGSSIGTAESNLKAYAPDALWGGAKRFQTGASEEEVADWLSEIGFH